MKSILALLFLFIYSPQAEETVTPRNMTDLQLDRLYGNIKRIIEKHADTAIQYKDSWYPESRYTDTVIYWYSKEGNLEKVVELGGDSTVFEQYPNAEINRLSYKRQVYPKSSKRPSISEVAYWESDYILEKAMYGIRDDKTFNVKIIKEYTATGYKEEYYTYDKKRNDKYKEIIQKYIAPDTFLLQYYHISPQPGLADYMHIIL